MWTRFLTVILVSLLMDEARQTPKTKRPGQGFGRSGGFGGFRTGAGPGSYSSGHSFTNAFLGGALGALGGMLAFEGGKYIILSMDTPFFYEGRDYYFDIYPRMRDDLILCSVSLNKLKQLSGKPVRAKREDPWSSSMTSPLTTISTPPTTMKPDEVLDSIQYRNGTQPQVITWACIRDVELCCGTDCCPEDDDVTVGNVLGWIVLIIIIGLVVIACCISLCHAEAPQGVQHDNPSPQVHGPDGHSQSYSKEGDPSTDKPPEGPPEGYQPERFPDRSLEKQKGAKTSKEGSISASKGASKLKESGQKLEEGVPGKRSRNQKKEKKS